LIVFRDGFLCSAPGARGNIKKTNNNSIKEEEGLEKEFSFWEHGIQIQFPKNLSRIGVNLNPWRVTIHRLANKSEDKTDCLDRVDYFLNGNFSYEIEVPVESSDADDVTLVVLSDYKKADGATKNNGSRRNNIESNDKTIQLSSDFELIPVRDLSPVDQRLKSGLPLLVPYVRTEIAASKKSNFFRLEYSHINYVKNSPTKTTTENDRRLGTPTAFSSALPSSLSSKSPSPPKLSKHSPEISTSLLQSTPSPSPSTPVMQVSTPPPSTPAVALTPASLPTIPMTVQGDRYHQPSSSKPSLSVSAKSPTRQYTPGSDDDTPPNSVFKQLQLEAPREAREAGRRLELNEFSNPNATPEMSPTNETSSSRSNSSDGSSPRVGRRRSNRDDFRSSIIFN